jgi:SHOCT-like domain
MSDERSRILGLVAEGRITAAEAERLLDALESGPGGPIPVDTPAASSESAAPPKYMYVKVWSQNGDTVNVKIPLGLVRAGLKLTSLIPPQAMDQINKSMAESGMTIDFASLKPENIEELIEALREMEVNVDSKNGDNVRVYCG